MTDIDARNKATSEREVRDFVNNHPDNYFAYVKLNPASDYGIITTWVGDKLGGCTVGRPFRSNMGDTRVPIWVNGINGCRYYGYYYRSAGDYCRIRKIKNGKNATP